MTCGDGRLGCLGHGDLNGATRPRLIEMLLSIDVNTVSCGSSHVVVLGSKGEVRVGFNVNLFYLQRLSLLNVISFF